jgi:hypothetical protein
MRRVSQLLSGAVLQTTVAGSGGALACSAEGFQRFFFASAYDPRSLSMAAIASDLATGGKLGVNHFEIETYLFDAYRYC